MASESAQIPCAVVGTGALGSIHTRILSQMPEAHLVGVCDTNPERAATHAKKFKTQVLPNLDAVIDQARAAIVAVPTTAHFSVASKLLGAGIPCMVEKPLARTLEEGRELVAIAKAQNVPLMVGHVERFNPAVLALLEKGLAPRFLEAQRVSPFSFRSSDVGVVLDMMIHDLDLILHLVRSPVKDVHAVGVNVLGDLEDMANARILFENGAVANLTASRVALKTERKLRLFAPDTYATLDFHKKTGRIVQLTPNARERLAQGDITKGDLSPLEAMMKKLVRTESLKVKSRDEPLLLEDREFLASIRDQRTPLVPGSHGLLAMEAAAQVITSLEQTTGAWNP